MGAGAGRPPFCFQPGGCYAGQLRLRQASAVKLLAFAAYRPGGRPWHAIRHCRKSIAQASRLTSATPWVRPSASSPVTVACVSKSCWGIDSAIWGRGGRWQAQGPPPGTRLQPGQQVLQVSVLIGHRGYLPWQSESVQRVQGIQLRPGSLGGTPCCARH